MLRDKRNKLTRYVSGAVVFAVLLTGAVVWSAHRADRSISPTRLRTEKQASERYGKLPLTFEVNQGQTDRQVKFLSRGSGYALFLTNEEAVLSLRDADAALRMNFVGGNRSVRVEGQGKLEGISNYILGNDPRRWQTNVPNYARVNYANLYPGIDLTYYGSEQQLEYDFTVAPGADPRAIALSIQGADKLAVDAEGGLAMQIAGGTVRQHKPVVYQEVNGTREEIAGSYQLIGSNRIGFQIGEYDHSLPLTIDPILDYSTYIGGLGNDPARSVAVDAEGNAYISGQTTSANFPTAGGPSPIIKGEADAYVVKLNAAGTALIYSTVFGGSGSESARGVAIDAQGDAYLTGFTSSNDFPTVNPIQSTYGGGLHDAFVAKLNHAGNAFVYSTYLGGALDECGYAIAVRHGSAYVTGVTNSANFPTANALQPFNAGGYDAFVTRVNRPGSGFVYSTYLGGSGNDVEIVSGDSTGNTSLAGIAVDEDDHAYVSGATNSINFPTKNPIQANLAGIYNAFVTKLSSRGAKLIYSTYLGGNLFDNGNRIALDDDNNAYVAGSTDSANFPTKNAIQPTYGGGFSDLFITKINPAGSALVYSTFLGGSDADFGFALSVAPNGSAFVGGYSSSTNFPTVNPIQPAHSPGANYDVVVSRLNPTGSALFYSTYLGGSGDDFGLGLASRRGAAYVVGNTASPNFPTTPNSFQPLHGGGNDGFIAKIIDAPETEVQCKNGGWQKFGPPAGPFKNQGQCIDFVRDRRDGDDEDRDKDDADHDHDRDH